MTTVYIIRHGELEYQVNSHGQRMLYGPDVPLSDFGKAQIAALAARMQKEGGVLTRIYTSPYRRAVESAMILAKVFGISDIKREYKLRDIDNSSAMNMTMDEVLARRGDFGADGHVESIAHLTERMTNAFQSIVKIENRATVAIVSHGDAIRTLLFRLEHPQGDIPPMKDLAQTDYLDKGEAWRVIVDDALRLVEREYIGRPPEQWGKGERKS